MGRSPSLDKLSSHFNKGAWTEQEDQILINYIKLHGEGSWRQLPKAAGLLRCGKSCRLRWTNYLRPDLRRGNFTVEEDEIIIKLHSLHGNKWSLIAERLPGRTDNEIKNYWNTHIRRKLLSQGLDPKTHLPIDAIATDNKIPSNNSHIPIAAAAASRPPTHDFTTQGANDNRGVIRKEVQYHQLPDLNLELSLHVSCQSSAEQEEVKQKVSPYQVLMKPQPVPVVSQNVCLCCNLGLYGKEGCKCQGANMDPLRRYF